MGIYIAATTATWRGRYWAIVWRKKDHFFLEYGRNKIPDVVESTYVSMHKRTMEFEDIN